MVSKLKLGFFCFCYCKKHGYNSNAFYSHSSLTFVSTTILRGFSMSTHCHCPNISLRPNKYIFFLDINVFTCDSASHPYK